MDEQAEYAVLSKAAYDFFHGGEALARSELQEYGLGDHQIDEPLPPLPCRAPAGCAGPATSARRTRLSLSPSPSPVPLFVPMPAMRAAACAAALHFL